MSAASSSSYGSRKQHGVPRPARLRSRLKLLKVLRESVRLAYFSSVHRPLSPRLSRHQSPLLPATPNTYSRTKITSTRAYHGVSPFIFRNLRRPVRKALLRRAPSFSLVVAVIASLPSRLSLLRHECRRVSHGGRVPFPFYTPNATCAIWPECVLFQAFVHQ